MAGPLIGDGATLSCPFGTTLSKLIVTSEKRVTAGGTEVANIMDRVPYKNIPPFTMCTSMANEAVAAATTAASGVLTPQPCTPIIPAPWAPGATTNWVGGQPAVTLCDTCMCICGAGAISAQPAQFTVETT